LNIEVALYAQNLARSFELNQAQAIAVGNDHSVSSATDKTPNTAEMNNSGMAQVSTPPANSNN